MTIRKFLLAVFKTTALFGFFGWVYIVINSEVHPQTLPLQLTHFWKYPHEDTFGEICFAVSFASYFFYNLLKEPRNREIMLVQGKGSKETDIDELRRRIDSRRQK